MFGWLKKVFSGIKKVGKAAPAVVQNPGVRVGLSFLGVPPDAIDVMIQVVKAVEKPDSSDFSKFGRAYIAAKPILKRYGITKRSDIKLIIEVALAIFEGRMERTKE
jgi:hypothetical protein